MVMKVSNIYPVSFRSIKNVTKPDEQKNEKPQTKELLNVTPDFNVKLPQRYTNLGVTKLYNGQDVYSYKLANGYRVTVVPMENSPVVVKNYVNVGSMNEPDDVKGISHFLEHMAFNGTEGGNGHLKLEVGDSFKRIEALGGWINASTSYAATDFVNSAPLLNSKDLEEQLKVIAAMTEDLALTPEMIEKEKGPVCSEINMIMDFPSTIAIDQTVRTLFNIRSSADELIAGSTNHIQNLTEEKVRDYYNKHYTPENMNLVVTGDVEPQEVIEMVSKLFKSQRKKEKNIYEEKMLPISRTVRKDFVTDKSDSANIVVGFSGPKMNDAKERMLNTIASRYLEQTDVGITSEFNNMNVASFLGLERISSNPEAPSMVYYSINCAENKVDSVLKLLFNKLSSVKSPDEKTIDKIKESVKFSLNTGLQFSEDVNSLIGSSIQCGIEDYYNNTEEILNSITAKDVDDYIKKYLNLNKAAITVTHPQKSDVITDKQAVSGINFKGSSREPLNLNKVKTQTLNNNYRVGFYETPNDNIYFRIKYNFDGMDSRINPVAHMVLGAIYSAGTKYMSEEEFDKFKEDNNIRLATSIGDENINLAGSCTKENFAKTIDKAKEIITKPRLTQEEFDKVVEKIKDAYSRLQPTSKTLYYDFDAETNPLKVSKEKVLETLETLTLNDVKDLHNYLTQNMSAIVTVNIPQKTPEFKEQVLEELNDFAPVKAYEYNIANVYTPNNEVQVLTKEKPVSQADIMQVFKFQLDNSPKEVVTAEILNTILSSSHSIGLFNTLREKEHLAYSVYSAIDKQGNLGELSCNILTTTDNKEQGEFSYENLQRSINGFNRQIDLLKRGEFNEEDLEIAKRKLKADLLTTEGVAQKLMMISKNMSKEEGLNYTNILYKQIDTISKEDIVELAEKIFASAPIYSIVASKDTLNANAQYLEKLKD